MSGRRRRDDMGAGRSRRRAQATRRGSGAFMAASIYTHRGRRVATLFEIIFRAAPGLAQRLADGLFADIAAGAETGVLG